ncbi:tRNA (guanine(46)-N(7))-methyltransferase TrmB [Rubrobacter radiotolerans]|uniref:tRNA (guanine-N(7)-)-methyltransferase n=2 Tax=Rubrobacter radiotolerans TaxID=42256 RepID=A0AB35TBT4_RUBRA|nr:methyltransferase domain-containing protein [Rubrobacter radiotolerans]MDX5894495.1 methyltransferase domain-containing protein [Rubrobacter radiotolerans]
MTRRKLGRMNAREPDAATAERYLVYLSGYDLHNRPEMLPRLDSRGLFGDEGPMEIEVGCGTGEFLCALAAGAPGTNFVGFDLHAKSLFGAVERASGADFGNVRFVRGDFRQMYGLFVPDSLRRVYLHFPDPGMKERYRKRRIFGERFLREMSRAVVRGGELSLVTDDEDYFQEMLALIETEERAAKGWRRAHGEPYLEGFEPPVKSRFQELWERRGRAVRRFLLVNGSAEVTT